MLIILLSSIWRDISVSVISCFTCFFFVSFVFLFILLSSMRRDIINLCFCNFVFHLFLFLFPFFRVSFSHFRGL